MTENVTRWSVDLYLGEIDGRTHAEARLTTDDTSSVTATGVATLSPHDHYDVPEIGYELAAGRALAALAEQLLSTALDDVEALN
jgi:hypothetical protein